MRRGRGRLRGMKLVKPLLMMVNGETVAAGNDRFIKRREIEERNDFSRWETERDREARNMPLAFISFYDKMKSQRSTNTKTNGSGLWYWNKWHTLVLVLHVTRFMDILLIYGIIGSIYPNHYLEIIGSIYPNHKSLFRH